MGDPAVSEDPALSSSFPSLQLGSGRWAWAQLGPLLGKGANASEQLFNSKSLFPVLLVRSHGSQSTDRVRGLGEQHVGRVNPDNRAAPRTPFCSSLPPLRCPLFLGVPWVRTLTHNSPLSSSHAAVVFASGLRLTDTHLWCQQRAMLLFCWAVQFLTWVSF